MAGADSKHEFAVYYPVLQDLLKNSGSSQQLVIKDSFLAHRIGAVLRHAPGDVLTFFDSEIQARCVLHSVNKKEIVCLCTEKNENRSLTPRITVYLPLLKKDDLEAALYSLVELGVNSIQLVETEKSRHISGVERINKERERLERVMIAAAEQSKMFAMPELHAPISFEQMICSLPKLSALVKAIFFDPEGDCLFSVINLARTDKVEQVLLFVGPEGDLAVQEKEKLKGIGVLFCKLTPTVLRAVQAVSLGAGVVRSVLAGEQK